MAARLPAICPRCGAKVELHLSVWCVPGTLTKHVCANKTAEKGGKVAVENSGPEALFAPPARANPDDPGVSP